MKLSSVTIKNFRSIREARKVSIGKCTVLLGPNNEGKSNILRAIHLGIETISLIKKYPEVGVYSEKVINQFISRIVHREELYAWRSDFPLELQKSKPNGLSQITLEFALTEDEIVKFKELTGSRLNGSLPIVIKFGDREVVISVVKQGAGQKTLNKKIGKIIQFCADSTNVEYIPAVRTAEQANEIVRSLVAKALQKVEKDKRFLDAIKIVDELQTPILRELEASIEGTIKKFIPHIKSTKLNIQGERRLSALRSGVEIVLDDGVPTPLKFKGDGVQSLVALGFMRHSSKKGTEGIVLLEEPESHLHPKAVRQLKRVVDELAETNQVVLTTHNPLFVNRMSVSSNVVVFENRAYSASSVAEIRDVLGVHVSDNLQGAELVLVVEGDRDKEFFCALAKSSYPILWKAISENRPAIDPLGSASKLSYKASFHKLHMCAVMAFLDNDQSGNAAVKACLDEAHLERRDVTLASCPGRKESELEDLFVDKLTQWCEPLLRSSRG